MDHLRSIRVLIKVADQGSFIAAARSMDISAPVATRLIVDLERHLNVRLLNRTTRSVTLTAAGAEYVERMRKLLEEMDAVDSDVGSRSTSPHGLLRISCPANFSRAVLIKEIPRFRERYANVDIEFGSLPSAETPDPAADVSVIIDRGRPLDGMFVAHRIAATRVVLSASKSFVDAHGPIGHPRQLDELECLIPTFGDGLREFSMTKSDGARAEQHVFRQRKGRIRSHDPEMLLTAALQGIGIVGMPSFAAKALLESGELIRVLPEWDIETWHVYATTHSRKHIPRGARDFINFLIETFGGNPDDGWMPVLR